MRFELLGAIGLTALLTAACGGGDNPDLGASAGGAGTTFGAGGAAAGAAGVSGSPTGNAGFSSGAGGVVNGGGGFQPGAGGSQPVGGQTGAGGGQTGAGGGGTGMVTCPATQPNNGDACTGFGGCTYGGMFCRCRRAAAGGTTRTWQCASIPDGGFTRPPQTDGGLAGDGGFTPPATCTHASDCTTAGDVCCGFRRGAFCVSSANCTQFGGTPQP